MPRSVSLDMALEDLLKVIGQVQSFTHDMTIEQYHGDVKTQRAVERCLEVISEASRRIPNPIEKQYPDIPWRNIAGIGNVLRHDYQRIANQIIWDTVRVHLPKLLEVVLAIKADLSKDGDPH